MVHSHMVYSSKIIKAGALLSDTKILLAQWDEEAGVAANLGKVLRENPFGKASRSRIEDILAILKQRYLVDPQVRSGLVTLARQAVSAEILDRILYFFAAQADPLLYDFVVDVLAPWQAEGKREVSTGEVLTVIQQWATAGKTTTRWSGNTSARVARELLCTLRDFGLLEGAVHKRIAPFYLPTRAFAYVAFFLYKKYTSGDRLLHAPEWRLFYLAEAGVERLFLEAHLERLLEYHAAGRVIRLDFPARSLEEYARVIAARPH